MAETKIKTLFSLESAKAWVAGAIVIVTQVASYVVPDSPPGKIVASILGVLVAIGAVFGVTNAKATPNLQDVDWTKVDFRSDS